MNLKDPRVGQTVLVFAAILVALNIGMALARFDFGTATGWTVTSLVLWAVLIVLILSKILRRIWNDRARRP